MKLPKCWLRFNKKLIVSVIIIFGTLSFPVVSYLSAAAVYVQLPTYADNVALPAAAERRAAANL